MAFLMKKKGNKQCLFDTPRILTVNKENNVRIQRPQNMQKAGFLMNQLYDTSQKSSLSSQRSHFVKKKKFSASNFFMHFKCACNVKAKYKVNPSRPVIGVDRPVYALS